MSKFFENKQLLVHVVSEVVVLIGITYYFSGKNKKLMNHIEDLVQRIEEQEDIIQQHDQQIKKLISFHVQKSQQNTIMKKQEYSVPKQSEIIQKQQVVKKNKQPVVVKEEPVVELEEESSEEENDDELDAEIASELRELSGDIDSTSELDLKKKI